MMDDGRWTSVALLLVSWLIVVNKKDDDIEQKVNERFDGKDRPSFVL